MALYTLKFFEASFKNEESKKAYLKACQWLAENIISKVEMEDILFKVKKVKDSDLPTFKVELYITLEEEQFVDSFCARCKEFHSSFYLNQQYNCDACNMQSFRKGLNQKLGIKKSYNKEKLRAILED